MTTDDTKVDQQTAEFEFDRFLYTMELETDTGELDEDELKAFNSLRDTFVKAVMAGRLVVNESGEPVYTPVTIEDATPLTFHEPTGAAFMAMDRRKQGEDMAKMAALMGAITKTGPARFSKMGARDWKVCQAITALFMG